MGIGGQVLSALPGVHPRLPVLLLLPPAGCWVPPKPSPPLASHNYTRLYCMPTPQPRSTIWGSSNNLPPLQRRRITYSRAAPAMAPQMVLQYTPLLVHAVRTAHAAHLLLRLRLHQVSRRLLLRILRLHHPGALAAGAGAIHRR
jgi:hypothetical protein